MDNNLDEFINNLISGKYKNIIVLTGAGVSTSAGIPDYRSVNGLFSGIDIPPEKFFSRKYRAENPEIAKEFDTKIKEIIKSSAPTFAHILCVYLHKRGWLRRVYTQNIDNLHERAGLPADKIYEVHGSLTNASFSNVVLYGDSLKPDFPIYVKSDFTPNVDLILIMGTTLQVAPFCALPNLVTKNCTRVLVTKNPQVCFINGFERTMRYQQIETMYNEPAIQSWTKLAGRKVTLRPQWTNKKYPKQYIFDMDVQDFSSLIISSLGV